MGKLATFFSLKFAKAEANFFKPLDTATNIFIYPGKKIKSIDGLITNFHLPQSTLLLLVSAFGGHEQIKLAYKHAITKKYRFYSYGDAMLII